MRSRLKNTGNVDFTDVTLTEVVPYTGTINGSHPFALFAGATDTTHFTVSQVLTSADILSRPYRQSVACCGCERHQG